VRPRLQGPEIVAVERKRPAQIRDRPIVLMFLRIGRSTRDQRLDLSRQLALRLKLSTARGN
jgi:hypothetical protein